MILFYHLRAKLPVTVAGGRSCRLCMYILSQSLSISSMTICNHIDSFHMKRVSLFRGDVASWNLSFLQDGMGP